MQEILTNWQSNFDIEDGPVYSTGYIYGYADGSARVYFALHHLIVDSVSWRILAEDLRDIYNGKDLGAKGSSYRQWVEAVIDYPNTNPVGRNNIKGTGGSEQDYWEDIGNEYYNYSNELDSKLDNLIISEDTTNHASIILSKEQTDQLLKESNRIYNTQVNDLLLTALAYTVNEVS